MVMLSALGFLVGPTSFPLLPPPPEGVENMVRLGCVHDDNDDIRSASMLESKLVKGDPIPVLIDWSLELTERESDASVSVKVRSH